MIYVHCEAPSEGAALLIEHLRGVGLGARRTRTVDQLMKRIKTEDVIIGWGQFIPVPQASKGLHGVKRVFNGKQPRTKLRELQLLEDAGVPVPPFDTRNWGKGWLPRSMHHQEGSDFFPPGERPPVGFYTKKLDIVEEYRFHIFKRWNKETKAFEYVSIRAGKKVPREGKKPHPWIRSWNHGWAISYGGYKFPSKGRNAAKKALEAVGYDFGAVDVGILKGGEVVVLEVNSRPGLEPGGQTVLKYVQFFKEAIE